MKVLETISRKDLIEIYLRREERDKQKAIPPGRDRLDWDNPNEIDGWLQLYCYKHGVIGGFKEWALVELTKNDVLDCAIVNHIPDLEGCPQRLGTILSECRPRAMAWQPGSPKAWYEPLSSGGEFELCWAVILRCATPGEKNCGAKWYVEDGSGRFLCYARRLFCRGEDGKALGYLGYKPDLESDWLSKNLDSGHFIKNHAVYQEPCLLA